MVIEGTPANHLGLYALQYAYNAMFMPFIDAAAIPCHFNACYILCSISSLLLRLHSPLK